MEIFYLQELCERLWDISDKRKEEDEQERDALMGKGWLEDHTAVLINHHSILMQVTFQILSNHFSYVPFKLMLYAIAFHPCVSDLLVFIMFRLISPFNSSM